MEQIYFYLDIYITFDNYAHTIYFIRLFILQQDNFQLLRIAFIHDVDGNKMHKHLPDHIIYKKGDTTKITLAKPTDILLFVQYIHASVSSNFQNKSNCSRMLIRNICILEIVPIKLCQSVSYELDSNLCMSDSRPEKLFFVPNNLLCILGEWWGLFYQHYCWNKHSLPALLQGSNDQQHNAHNDRHVGRTGGETDVQKYISRPWLTNGKLINHTADGYRRCGKQIFIKVLYSVVMWHIHA